jgi:outer membrane lipoprotein SlyB
MSETKSKVSPIVAIAAGSVIVFSAVGVAVMTGVIPSSFSKNESVAASAPSQGGSAPSQSSAPPQVSAPAQPAKPVAVAPARTQQRTTEAPKRVAAARSCAECGTITAVNVVERQGEGSGLGAVAGGVVGGVLGNQIGDGSGRRIATVAGAAGGAYAGHQIEKHVKTAKQWNVVVRMEDGTSRVFPFDAEPGYRAGDKVKIADGRLVAR